MKIAMGADHAGYRLKEIIKNYLKENGHEVLDMGTNSDNPVDYPFFIRPAAVAVSKGKSDRGIVLGGSGNGEAMVANRIKGVRCAVCWNDESAILAKKHNDANMVSIGARMVSDGQALEIVRLWLKTSFEGGRHLPRILQIDQPLADKKTPDETERQSSGPAIDKPDRDAFNLLISFGYILYSEGRKQIEFKVDPGLKEPTRIHVPSSASWNKNMPEWARDRRDIILDRLKTKCSHIDYTLVEY